MIENLQFIQTPAQQLCEDFELCRVWDSLVYEDDQEDEFQIGLEASGALGETQTRQILYLDLIVSKKQHICMFLFGGPVPRPISFHLASHDDQASCNCWRGRKAGKGSWLDC